MTDLIRINRPLRSDGRPGDVATLRRMFWANAVSVEGLAADEAPDMWAELLGEPPKGSRWDLDFRDGKGVWTCGLVAEGIWRRMRVGLDALYKPYVSGEAIVRAEQYAMDVGAWVTPGNGRLPRVGDYLVVYTPNTHALTVTDVVEADGAVDVESVDGGQLDSGWQSSRRLSRPWVETGRRVLLDGRLVYGWVDVSRLIYRDPWCWVPAGFEL